MTKILLPEPVPFYTYQDEKNFFSWLESIPAVKSLVGVPGGVELTLIDPIDDDSLESLIAITTRYGLKATCLAPLTNEQNAHWFTDKGAYWYTAVFGNA